MTGAAHEPLAPGVIQLRVKLAGGHFGPQFPEECEPHSPEGPDGYGAWHDWAAQMRRTHVQRQCKGCGLWAIWEPKPGGALEPKT